MLAFNDSYHHLNDPAKEKAINDEIAKELELKPYCHVFTAIL
jgi:hypothetical protein